MQCNLAKDVPSFFYINFFIAENIFFLYTYIDILPIEIRVGRILDAAQPNGVELMISHIAYVSRGC